MTDKEYSLKLSEVNVRSQKLRVREAKIEMEEGYKRLKAKMESQYENLKANYEMALIGLEEAELDLAKSREEAEKNFD
jgi:hypothetical protein